jgi:hypothetical protein
MAGGILLNRFFYLGFLLSVWVMGMSHAVYSAAPSFSGGTGWVLAPTAEILPEKTGAFSFHTTDMDKSSVRIGYAITSKMEIGLSSPDIRNNASDWRLDAKYRLIGESLLSPSLSAGLNSEGYYIVMTKNFENKGITLNGGFGTNGFNGAFFGIEKSLRFAGQAPSEADKPVDNWPGLRLGLIAEYCQGSPNFGLRLNLSPNIAIDGGIKNFGTPVVGISFWNSF